MQISSTFRVVAIITAKYSAEKRNRNAQKIEIVLRILGGKAENITLVHNSATIIKRPRLYFYPTLLFAIPVNS